ncbi:heme ABC exporter ATP-binding protein CcmA [Longibacter salinarum]|uniref:Heme ABC exporter ATP-binding protein CcmA n=1 Tax=Longibacter salinarum TaxID=1850348 RepID=A0A2A8D0X1_9BACT|nr:ABC transporter ATP-binding protein [Longibacter salinarum]PEN14612.1 heme ABC exporter ATP-binding protein CcmA [Longibacter salinarum]
MPVLRAVDVGQNFGSLLLFRRMSFEVIGGESLAITGSNGSGKSTLLKILSGVMTPKAGEVELVIDGRTVDDMKRPLHVGLVAPYLSVYDNLSARENLEFLARARGQSVTDGASDTAAGKRIASVLQRVGLEGREDDLVGTFSSGMKQRVKYAAAMLPRPDVLLLDEPSANLDVEGIAMVEEVMEWQLEADRILIVATNVAAEAEECDRTLSVESFRS